MVRNREPRVFDNDDKKEAALTPLTIMKLTRVDKRHGTAHRHTAIRHGIAASIVCPS